MTAFSASGVITVSSDREAGNDEDSGKESLTVEQQGKCGHELTFRGIQSVAIRI